MLTIVFVLAGVVIIVYLAGVVIVERVQPPAAGAAPAPPSGSPIVIEAYLVPRDDVGLARPAPHVSVEVQHDR